MTEEHSAATQHLASTRRRLQLAMADNTTISPQNKAMRYLPVWLQYGLEIWRSRNPSAGAGWLLLKAVVQLLKPIANSRPLTLVIGAVIVGGIAAKTRAWRWLLKPLVLQAAAAVALKKYILLHAAD